MEKLKKEIEQIKNELRSIGPMHPGSISSQYHACGNPSCKCHDPDNPQKHGPYNKLTYVYRGKSKCRFVRAEHLEELRERLQNYKRFKKLMDRWIKLSIETGREQFFDKAKTGTKRSSPKKR